MNIEIDELRKLRNNTNDLSDHIMDDLSSYVHRVDQRSFVRLPESKHVPNDVGVTVTCSCLMGLAQTGHLKDFDKRLSFKGWNATDSFKLILNTPIWCSSGLLQMNAFTSTLVLRTFGFLIEKGELISGNPVDWVHNGEQHIRNDKGESVPASSKNKWTLLEVFTEFGRDVPHRLAVEKYPTSAALVYWFLDAIQRIKLNSSFNKAFWEAVSSWAAKEFWKQESLVIAENDALMDPVAMAMAACVCKKLKTLAEADTSGTKAEYLHLLPSEAELDFSVKLLFLKQAGSGIWPKYFPLFHYPDVGGNFCFTFEMLEALLNEFGKGGGGGRILEIEGVFGGLSRALNWCKRNRFAFRDGDQTYSGWNSGGQISSLTGGKPESWASAVVHMFLWELRDVLSRKIEQQVLASYNAIRHKYDATALTEFADIAIVFDKTHTQVKSLLVEHMIKPAQKDELDIREKGLTGKVSALLFGPPGTSKTELCAAVAKSLGWPLVLIDPSHFLEGGLERISVRADKIFTDLLDLNGAIVLFDEMDPLVQTRDDEEARLDIMSQFLTTSMLPKLAKLHERKRVIFFMATNFQNRFDPAIKRAGRFDLLLCMGPPCLDSKLSDLRLFLSKGTASDEVDACSRLLTTYTAGDPELAELLELFLFGEFKSFLKNLHKIEPLSAKLARIGANEFKRVAAEASEFNYLRLNDLKPLKAKLNRKTVKELEGDTNMNYDYLKANDLKLHPIVRYLADKHQSKVHD
jgi:hypothetical protein